MFTCTVTFVSAPKLGSVMFTVWLSSVGDVRFGPLPLGGATAWLIGVTLLSVKLAPWPPVRVLTLIELVVGLAALVGFTSLYTTATVPPTIGFGRVDPLGVPWSTASFGCVA